MSLPPVCVFDIIKLPVKNYWFETPVMRYHWYFLLLYEEQPEIDIVAVFPFPSKPHARLWCATSEISLWLTFA